MLNLKPLLNNQKLHIDSHGHAEAKWDNPSYEIHLHKETKFKIDGEGCSVNIIVPLNTNGKVRCEKGKGKGRCERRMDIPRLLEEEIKDAFADDAKRAQFVNELRQELKKFPSDNGDEKQIEDALQRIANAFGIKSLVDTSIIQFYSSGKKYITYYLVIKDSDEYYRISSNRYGIVLQDWPMKKDN